jgi:BASS family bile acid:Na+ symporter
MLVITAWWGVWHIISGLTLAFLWRWRGRKEANEE